MSVRKKVLRQADPQTGASQEVVWWIADYADGNGSRHQVRFKHKRDALAAHLIRRAALKMHAITEYVTTQCR